MSNKTGGPAFPLYRGQGYRNDGMTLRDYFAAKAMQALVSDTHVNRTTLEAHQRIADLSFSIADAMIAEREKDNE